jgi:hypothetical protein
MGLSEEYYIKLCIRKIEESFSFLNSDGSSQRNLTVLSIRIKEKTGVSISLSTLKRIWKGEFKQIPQKATLDALIAILEYKDWQDFKERNHKKSNKIPSLKFLISIALLLLVGSTLYYIFYRLNDTKTKEPIINGLVQFSAKKTVFKGIPTTVFFKYDISKIEADSFYFVQSWNNNLKEPVEPESNTHSTIYYESGYHRARLIANNTQIAMTPIHIISDGWEPHVYYSNSDLMPINFQDEVFIEDGCLHLDESLLKKKQVDFSKYFYSRIVNSQPFNVHTDNFEIRTKIKLDSLLNSTCPWFELILVNEKHIFMVTVYQKGCEKHTYYKLGEIERFGNSSDLSGLGLDLFEWQEIGISVKNRNAAILINNKTVYKETFKEDFGKLTALIFAFERTGAIDFVRLYNNDGNMVFSDDFD